MENILSYTLPSYTIAKYFKNQITKQTIKQNVEQNNISKQYISQETGLKMFVYTYIGGIILAFLLYVAAFYLSYKCNTACTPQMTIVEKILRGGLAVFFAPFYLLAYFLLWSAECNKCK